MNAAAASARSVHTIFGNPMVGGGISNTVRDLLDNMTGPLLQRRLWYPVGDPKLARDYHRPIFNHYVWRALRKVRVPSTWLNRAMEHVALANVRAGDIVYIWPPYSLPAIRRARERGAIVVAEKINTMGSTYKTLLERAYGRIGRPLPAGWCLPEAIARERAEMAACDFVAAPSDAVAQSLLDAGIPHGRIMRTSYGWSPLRLAGAVGIERPERTPVFAFVGSGVVRKGLNLLLEAWEKAAVTGKLLVVGPIHEEIRAVASRHLARSDVELLGYVEDLTSVYAAADVFVLPSHEEGSAQVTYEAAGCGLALIVSPLGANPIVRHAEEGFVIDPFDVDAWADAIRRLAADAALRRRFGRSAAARAKEYTWQRVGARLYERFVEATRSAGERQQAEPYQRT